MDFQYHELGAPESRLLKPETIGPFFLSFQMIHCRREDSPHYTAISYTWSDGVPIEQICISGHFFRIRRNLYECLYCLGRRALIGGVDWTQIWVDAVCIDQKNDAQRSEQVRRMDTVYRDAATVSVWLGAPTFSKQEADFYRLSVFDKHPWTSVRRDRFREALWHLVDDLANHTYWNRFWVIQEFLLADKVDICFGAYHMNSASFRHIIEEGQSAFGIVVKSLAGSKGGLGLKAWPLLEGRAMQSLHDSQSRPPGPLCELLLSHGDSKCKDPRDRAFALLRLIDRE